MSADASVGAREGSESLTTDYSSMLESLDTAISEAERKVENGRVYDVENEKVRIKWIRALAYAINVRRQVASDRDLEELAEEIEELKRTQSGEGGL